MSKRDPKITLLQILDHARRLQELSLSYSLPEVLEDWKLVGALEREAQILGEAVRRLPPGLIAQYPQVPWKKIVGTRDRLSHGCDEIDYRVLWAVAGIHAPLLLTVLERMLAELPPKPDFRVEEPLDLIVILGRVHLLKPPPLLPSDETKARRQRRRARPRPARWPVRRPHP